MICGGCAAGCQQCAGCGVGAFMMCNGCKKPFFGNVPILGCAKCHSVWYHNKDCQKKHWKEHKEECRHLISNKKVQGLLSPSIAEDCTAETIDALNRFTTATIGSARFFCEPETGHFLVEFENADNCKIWCNEMNLGAFPNQQGGVILLRKGKGAKELGIAFRLPTQLDAFVMYICEGRIYFQKGWRVRRPPSRFHHDQETFKKWMIQQIECLAVAVMMKGKAGDEDIKEMFGGLVPTGSDLEG